MLLIMEKLLSSLFTFQLCGKYNKNVCNIWDLYLVYKFWRNHYEEFVWQWKTWNISFEVTPITTIIWPQAQLDGNSFYIQQQCFLSAFSWFCLEIDSFERKIVSRTTLKTNFSWVYCEDPPLFAREFEIIKLFTF